jgi:hypothetical protein
MKPGRCAKAGAADPVVVVAEVAAVGRVAGVAAEAEAKVDTAEAAVVVVGAAAITR